MYARLTTIVFDAAQPVDVEQVFRQVLPALEDLAGFRGIFMLSGADGTQLVVLTLSETAEALETAVPLLEGIKRDVAVRMSVATALKRPWGPQKSNLSLNLVPAGRTIAPSAD